MIRLLLGAAAAVLLAWAIAAVAYPAFTRVTLPSPSASPR